MFWFLVALVSGLLIGWATPQPAWADTLSAWIAAKFNELKSGVKTEKNDF